MPLCLSYQWKKNKLSENQLQSTTETHYRHQELSKYGWVDPTISEELESNHLAINVSPLLGIPVGDNLSISHRRSAWPYRPFLGKIEQGWVSRDEYQGMNCLSSMAVLLRKSDLSCSRIATSHGYRLVTFTISTLNCSDKTLPCTPASCWGKNFNSTSIFIFSFLALVCQKMEKQQENKALGAVGKNKKTHACKHHNLDCSMGLCGTLRAIDQNRMPGKCSGHQIPLCANQLWNLESLQTQQACHCPTTRLLNNLKYSLGAWHRKTKETILKQFCQEPSQLCCLWQESQDDRKNVYRKEPRSWATFQQMQWKRAVGCSPNLWNVQSKHCSSFASKPSSYLTHQTTNGWLFCPVPYGGLAPEVLCLVLW